MADIMSRKKRSALMSRIKGKNTKPEMIVRSTLHRAGYRFRIHHRGLPGRPDLVFARAKVAVFVEGDFWHGYRFPTWRGKLTRFWREKIGGNRRRDRRNFARLRRMGWKVVRVWEHEVERDVGAVKKRIVGAINEIAGKTLNTCKEGSSPVGNR